MLSGQLGLQNHSEPRPVFILPNMGCSVLRSIAFSIFALSSFQLVLLLAAGEEERR